MKVEVTCSECSHRFTVDPASMLAKSKPRAMSEKAVIACRENARKPRPNAKGKPKERKNVKG